MAYSPFNYKGQNPDEDINIIIQKGETPLRNRKLELPNGCPPIDKVLGEQLIRCLGNCLDPNYKKRPTPQKIIKTLDDRIEQMNF